MVEEVDEERIFLVFNDSSSSSRTPFPTVTQAALSSSIMMKNLTTAAAATAVVVTTTSTSAPAATQVEGGVAFGPSLVNDNLGDFYSTDLEPQRQPPSYSEVTGDRNWVVVGILIGLIVILWMVLAFMLCVPLIRYIRRKIPVSQKRIDRRYETIEGWLITKAIKPHDDCCDRIRNNFSSSSTTSQETPPTTPTSLLLLPPGTDDTTPNTTNSSSTIQPTKSYDSDETTTHGGCCSIANTTKATLSLYPDSSSSSSSSSSSDDDDDNEDGCTGPNHYPMECPICMEPFEIDQIVSWSAYEHCNHVFHHQCIKEWLLRHKNCPFCREIFLPVDTNLQTTRHPFGNHNPETTVTGSTTTTKLTSRLKKATRLQIFKELTLLRNQRSDTTYFCIQHGLVVIIPRKLNGSRTTSTTTNTTAVTLSSSRHRHPLEIYPERITKSDLEQMRLKIKSQVPKQELKKLRGSRIDKSSCPNLTEEDNKIEEDHPNHEIHNHIHIDFHNNNNSFEMNYHPDDNHPLPPLQQQQQQQQQMNIRMDNGTELIEEQDVEIRDTTTTITTTGGGNSNPLSSSIGDDAIIEEEQEEGEETVLPPNTLSMDDNNPVDKTLSLDCEQQQSPPEQQQEITLQEHNHYINNVVVQDDIGCVEENTIASDSVPDLLLFCSAHSEEEEEEEDGNHRQNHPQIHDNTSDSQTANDMVTTTRGIEKGVDVYLANDCSSSTSSTSSSGNKNVIVTVGDTNDNDDDDDNRHDHTSLVGNDDNNPTNEHDITPDIEMGER